MALLALTPVQLTPGGLSPADLTTLLSGSPLGSNTGVTFVNDGRTILFVQTNSTGNTTAVSDIPIQVQGEQVPSQSVTEAASQIEIFGPYPSQFNAAATQIVEVDLGTVADVSGVVAVRVPGVN